MTYEFQVVTSIAMDVLHDVSISHPFGDHREFPIVECVKNTGKIEDVWVG